MTPEQLQQLIISYNLALESGEISKEEYVALIQGIDIMEGIADDAEGLARKEQLNVILNAAISAASMLA
jgi:hypothetical protein